MKRLLCFFGWHYGDLFAAGHKQYGLGVGKRCACGRFWFDSAGPFSDPMWIPCYESDLREWKTP